MFASADKVYTAGQVRGIDEQAIHGLGIPGYELMCRAGAAVVDVARNSYPSARRWLVLCGPGNNGGDGYVVARLAASAGVRVSVCSLIEPQRLAGDAARAHADWLAAGGRVLGWPPAEQIACDLALDALLGTGIDRAVRGRYREAIAYLNGLACPKIAIDIPSGLNADTGCVMGDAVRARHSVTFVGRKRGMYTADGPDCCGRVSFHDLDVPAQAGRKVAAEAGLLLTPDCLSGIPARRPRNSHKGTFGHVLAVGGARGMSGAVRLCGEAALRSGAGRVTLLTDPAHADVVNLSRPELMVRAVAGGDDCRPLLQAAQAVAVGPGLGASAWSESLLAACLQGAAPLVVDADGLNLLAGQSPEAGVPGCKRVFTPHPAEAARLLACEPVDVQLDRVAAAVAIARQYAACVVLKGCGTVVADASGAYAICAAGNPGMATAGSGDVLTGIIAALLGQGLEAFDAARAGALAHARAGDLASEQSGEVALLAGDIIAQLPAVWKSAAP